MKNSTILKNYMRMAYEEYGELLCQKFMEKYPNDKHNLQKFKKIMSKLIESEFGKSDKGGICD